MEIIFTLIEPAVPENVGACARAIKTMGFGELRLVNPCDFQSTEAKMLAHGSLEILSGAKVYKSLEAALTDCDFIIGTSAKHRRVKHDYYPVTSINELISKKGETIKKISLVFGREESGMKNEELFQCDIISFVPMKTIYPSLNLAQAVMIYAFELSKLKYPVQINNHSENGNSFVSLKDKAAIYLKKLKIDKNETLYYRILERLNLLNQDDIHLLHSVFKNLKL